jgi:hypothetical protein
MDARKWIYDRVTLILDNHDSDMYHQLNAKILEDLEENDGGLQGYALLFEGTGSGAPYTREEYAQVAALTVRDFVLDHISDDPNDFAAVLLRDLLDVGDRQQWEMIGDHYLPEQADLEAAGIRM